MLEKNLEALECDVLVAPHNGSKTSLTPSFIKAVDTAHCIYSWIPLSI